MPTYSTTAAAASYVKQGALGVKGIYSTKRKNLSDDIVWQDRKWARLDNILRQEAQIMVVKDPEPKTLQKTEEPMRFSVASSAGSSSGSKYDLLYLTNANSRFIQANDILMCPNVFCDYNGSNYTTTKGATYPPETMLVSSVVEGATNATITVKRGNGHEPSTPSQITTSHYLVRIGHALPDGSSAPIAIQYEPEALQTYVQTFSKTWSETEVESNTEVYGKETMEDKAKRARKEFMRMLEFSHFYGRRGYKTVSGQRVWQAGGLNEAIPGSSADRGWTGAPAALDGTARMIDFGGAFDPDTFREKMEIVFRYGSEDKVALVGGKLYSYLLNVYEKYVRVNDALSARWGGVITELETGHGLLQLVRHPIFTEMDTSQTAWAADMAIVDLAYCKLLVLQNMDVKVKGTIEDEDEHLSKGEIYCTAGLWVMHPTTHAWIYGITG